MWSQALGRLFLRFRWRTKTSRGSPRAGIQKTGRAKFRREPMTDQGAEYAAYLRELVELERARRDSVNARSDRLVVTSIALTGLASTLAAWLGSEVLAVHWWIRLLYAGSALLFLAGGTVAFIAGRMSSYSALSNKAVLKAVGEWWKDDVVSARSRVAQARARMILTLRETTAPKTRLVDLAYVVFGVGLISLLAGGIAHLVVVLRG